MIVANKRAKIKAEQERRNSRRASQAERRNSTAGKQPMAPDFAKMQQQQNQGGDIMKRKIMVRDPFNGDNIEYVEVLD